MKTITTRRLVFASIFIPIILVGAFFVIRFFGEPDPAAAEALAASYIRAHIAELSPEPAVLGGSFYVTGISFPSAGRALVSYEDGHIALSADVRYAVRGSAVDIVSVAPAGAVQQPE